MDSKEYAYDLDGVLAEKPPASELKWGKMRGEQRQARVRYLIDHYRHAKRILTPMGRGSIVISARKEGQEVRSATLAWFLENYGATYKLFLLNKSRSVENVIEFKTEVLRSNPQVKYYYEDNKKILKGLKKNLPYIKYFYVDEQGQVEDF